MANHQDTIPKAIEHLRKVISPDDEYAFRNTTIECIRREALEIEKEQAAKLDQRLQSYAGVIEVLCQGYPPMAFLWVRSNSTN